MNQEKIGKFILKLRKDKNMTQQDLANKLNVTDRAISHWENGRSIPDVSLFKPICEVFNISVNELISGEKISKNNLINKSDENIINTLNNSKKNKIKVNIIITILSILIGLLLILFISNKEQKYPKIDLYNFNISVSDPEKQYSLVKMLDIGNRKIYYYGIDYAHFCNKKEKCYGVINALRNKQITLKEFKNYLDKQVEYQNYQTLRFYDGGTIVYKKGGIQIIYCNTTKGNKDVYIGNEEMLDNLNGEYCGHPKNENKSYIRTYKVINSKINDKDMEFNDITLMDNKGNKGNVLINNSYILIPGHTYEFSFLTFDKFEDTIENIFNNSTISKVTETDKSQQINEKIIINNDLYNNTELKGVRMDIEKWPNSNSCVTLSITDYSNNKYVYGASYRIEKYENGKWEKLNYVSKNLVAFNSMAYFPDYSGHLKFDVCYGSIYGELKSGKYRIIKDVLIEGKCCDHYDISAEFNIE